MIDSASEFAANLEKTKQLIFDNNHFLLTTHINPDGDGIGSELALARFLRKLGKHATVLNSTQMLQNYKFLDTSGEIQIFDPLTSPAQFSSADVIFIMDISKWERLGAMTEFVRNHSAVKVCIDHHPVCESFADVRLVCVDACASGELVLELILAMDTNLTTDIAAPLYASLVTDTGAFRFPNTTTSTHLAAAKLLSTGIDSAAIYEQIYERCSPERVKLLGLALYNIQYLHSGRLAYMSISQPMMKQAGVTCDELDGFADIARGVRNVEACFVFIELDCGKVKVSLRSKGNIDVNQYAAGFGGGGHRHASGILMSGPIDAAVERVLNNSSALFAVERKLVS